MKLGIYTTPGLYRKYQKKIGAMMVQGSSKTGTTGRINADAGTLTEFDPAETLHHVLFQAKDSADQVTAAIGNGSSDTLYKMANYKQVLQTAQKAQAQAQAVRAYYQKSGDSQALAALDELQGKLRDAEDKLQARRQYKTQDEYDAAMEVLQWQKPAEARKHYEQSQNEAYAKQFLQENGGSTGTLHTMANGRTFVTGARTIGSENGQLAGLQQTKDYLALQSGNMNKADESYNLAGTDAEKSRAAELYSQAVAKYRRANKNYGTLQEVSGAGNLTNPAQRQMYAETEQRIQDAQTGNNRLGAREFAANKKLVQKYGTYKNYLYGKIKDDSVVDDLADVPVDAKMGTIAKILQKDKLTDEDKARLVTAREQIRSSLNNPKGETWNTQKLTTYQNMFDVLQNKTAGFLQSGVGGFVNSALFGLPEMAEKKSNQKFAASIEDTDAKQAIESADQFQAYRQNYPAAYKTGELAGTVASMTGLGTVEGAAMKGIKGFAQMAPLAKSVVSSAALFGSDAMLRSASSQNWDKDVAKAIGNVGIDTAAGAVGGAASGAIGGLTGQGLTKALFKLGLQNNVVANNVARSISSAAGAAALTGTGEAKNAAMAAAQGKQYRTNWAGVAQTALTAGLTTYIMGSINAAEITEESKSRLQQLQAEYAAKFDALQKGAVDQNTAARNILEMAKVAADTNDLLQNEQFIGQQDLVDGAMKATDANRKILQQLWSEKITPEAQKAALESFQADTGYDASADFPIVTGAEETTADMAGTVGASSAAAAAPSPVGKVRMGIPASAAAAEPSPEGRYGTETAEEAKTEETQTPETVKNTEDPYLKALRDEYADGTISDEEYNQAFDDYYQGGTEWEGQTDAERNAWEKAQIEGTAEETGGRPSFAQLAEPSPEGRYGTEDGGRPLSSAAADTFPVGKAKTGERPSFAAAAAPSPEGKVRTETSSAREAGTFPVGKVKEYDEATNTVLDFAYEDYYTHTPKPISAGEYRAEFDTAYQYGKMGVSKAVAMKQAAENAPDLTPAIRDAAWSEGIRAAKVAGTGAETSSAAASGTFPVGKVKTGERPSFAAAAEPSPEGKVRTETSSARAAGTFPVGKVNLNGGANQNGGNVLLHDSGERNDGENPGIQAQKLAGGTGAAKTGAIAEVQQRINLQAQANAAKIEYQSSKAIGLASGTENKTLRVLPDTIKTKQMLADEASLKNYGAKSVTCVLGKIESVNQYTGKIGHVGGICRGQDLIVRADSEQYSYHQLCRHEEYHLRVQDEPRLRSSLKQTIPEKELDNLVQRYVEAYDGCYGTDELGAYEDEVLADVYANIDRRGIGANRYTQAAAQMLGGAETAKTAVQPTGPPAEKFSGDNQERKISAGMEDTERAEILRSKTFQASEYNGQAEHIIQEEQRNLAGNKMGLIKKSLARIAEEFQIPEIMKNEDTDLVVRYSNGTLKESAQKNIGNEEDLARLLPNLQAAVQNAIGIESHENRYFVDSNTKNFYVLLGGYTDANFLIPVRFGIKTRYDGKNSLYVAVSNQRIKEAEVKKPFSTEIPRTNGSRSASIISIKRLLEKVKDEDILRYTPDDFLNGDQRKIKYQAIADTIQYTNEKNDKAYRECLERGDLRTAERMIERAAAANGYQIQTHFGKNADMKVFERNVPGSSTKNNTKQIKSAETITYDDDGNVIPISKRFNSGDDDIRFSEESETPVRETLTTKAREYLGRTERALTVRIGDAMDVPKVMQRDYLKPIVQEISDEYLKNGDVKTSTTDRLFETAYKDGIVEDDTFYKQYKGIKEQLRNTAVTLAPGDRADIADYGWFVKSNIGKVRISPEGGMPVDTAYDALREQAPELFPASITHPADMLVRMADVAQSIQVAKKSLDAYYGEDAADFKAWAKNDFLAAVDDMKSELSLVKRYADDRGKTVERVKVPDTIEEVTQVYQEMKTAYKESEKAKAKTLLTADDDRQVGRLLKGEITPEELPDGPNKAGILRVYEAKKEYEKYASVIREYNRKRKEGLKQEADGYLKNANAWKDKKAGFLYERETLYRNIYDIIPSEEEAERVLDRYVRPVKRSVQQANKMKNDYRERVKALNLARGLAEGNIVSEAHAVQLLGEAQDNMRMIEKDRGRTDKRDGKTYDEWQNIISNLWAQNPNLNKEKITSAVAEFRKIYDELFTKMNETRVRNGYEPCNYRHGYFPHFQPGQTDGILATFAKALGIDAEVVALPTSINGMTHAFRPGITWFGNALERIGFNTAYDAVEGFDKYVEGAANVINLTDDIQSLRALASQIRYRTTDDGIREQVDKVMEDERLTEDEKRIKIEDIYKKGKFTLSTFVNDLEEFTNLLANKKSSLDRETEKHTGRTAAYKITKAIEARNGANMVAGNIASMLSNLIPLTQAGAVMSTKDILHGMWDTLKAYNKPDDIVERSAFLTNRRGSDPLVKMYEDNTYANKVLAWIENEKGHGGDLMGIGFEMVDHFTADSVIRGRYIENIRRGMSEEAAMDEADDLGALIFADRSKGGLPTIFSAKNPIINLFLQFQVEANNTFSFLFKDVPRLNRKKGILHIAMALMKFFIGSYLFNEIAERITGRRPALDPIGILNDATGDFTGYKLPNILEAGDELVHGKGIDFTANKKKPADAAVNLAGNVLEQVPGSAALNLVGMNLDGGRLPVAGTIPDLSKLIDAATNTGKAESARRLEAWKELQKPLFYLAMPYGGGQLRKMYQGIEAAAKGGSYSVDKDGNEVLQYPVYTDTAAGKVAAYTRGALFGKSSMPGAADWVDSGFQGFNAKETSAYKGMTQAGVGQEAAYKLLEGMSKIKKTDTMTADEAKRDYLLNADIPDEGKIVCYYALMASDKEKANIQEAIKAGVGINDYLKTKNAAAETEAEKDADGKAVPGSKKMQMYEAIDDLKLTADQKDVLAQKQGYTDTSDAPWHGMNYDKLENVVRTGKGLQSLLASMQKAGVQNADISGAITTLFKAEYQKANKSEQAELKARILTACELLGISRKTKAKQIDGWVK